MIKRVSLLVRKPELSRAEFARHWREVHAPLARRVPGLIRYTQNLVLEAGDRHPHLPATDTPVDGIAETYYADRASMERARDTPEAAAMLADGATFIASVTTFLVEEDVIFSD